MVTHDEWHKRANERSKKLKILDGSGYRAEETVNGTRLHMDIPKAVEEGAGGSSIKWAKITAVTNANNYTCSIWDSRASFVNGDTAAETGKVVRVPDIIDSMAVNRTFAVEAQSIITGVDYIAIQQLADI
jgi:hypothetical protein